MSPKFKHGWTFTPQTCTIGSDEETTILLYFGKGGKKDIWDPRVKLRVKLCISV